MLPSPCCSLGGRPASLSCSGGWKLFNGNAEHYTKPLPGHAHLLHRVLSIAYNKLSHARRAQAQGARLHGGFDDGVDLPTSRNID